MNTRLDPLANFPVNVKCERCNSLYTWKNIPYILSCGHTICSKCLKLVFEDFKKVNSASVKIGCSRCKQNDNHTLVYKSFQYNFKDFLERNFIEDYGLLTYIYSNYMENAMVKEAEDIVEDQVNPTEVSVIFDHISTTVHKDISTYMNPIIEEVKQVQPREILEKYKCISCERIFNYRNVPILMKCRISMNGCLVYMHV